MASLGLPKSIRLCRGADFARIKEDGRRVTLGCLILNWMPHPPGSTTRLGIITTRRLGGAVVRSRARRLLREAFRRHRLNFGQPADVVLIARASITRLREPEVERDLLEALRRARLLPRDPSLS